MSTMLEHDYIGLSETGSSDNPFPQKGEKNNVLHLKETELRLGLPGSESPPLRKIGFGISLFGRDFEENTNTNNNNGISPLKNFGFGAKRGSEAIDGSAANLGGNGGLLFSIGGCKEGLDQKNSHQSVKEVVLPPSPKPVHDKKCSNLHSNAPSAKAQVVGWPPIGSFRKNSMVTNWTKKQDDDDDDDDVEEKSGWGCLYVKVSMDGAPYLRKVDLTTYSNYIQLSSALGNMFTCFTIGQCQSQGLSESRLMDLLLRGSEYVLTYQDKDGDWMLVGDVPWEMFTGLCKRLRIMKGSEAIGLVPKPDRP